MLKKLSEIENSKFEIIEEDGDKVLIKTNEYNEIHCEDGPAKIWLTGIMAGRTECYYGGKLHNKFGPATIHPNGLMKWYQNGQLHCEFGPAVKHPCGSVEYWLNGKLHREDGPAIDNHDETEWYLNGLLHREDGPAVMNHHDLTDKWFLCGKELSKEKFKEFSSKK